MASAAFSQEYRSYLSGQEKTSMMQESADRLAYGLLGLSADTPIGVVINFFFYDTIRIFILLFFISVLTGVINTYPPVRVMGVDVIG